MADDPDEPTPDDAEPESAEEADAAEGDTVDPAEVDDVEAATGAAPDTTTGEPEPPAEVDDAAEDETARGAGEVGHPVEPEAGGVGGRWPGWAVPVVVGVALVIVVLGIAGLGGGGGDGDTGDEEVAAPPADDDGATDTTVGPTVPPVTTGPDAPPTAGLLSEIEPVESETWAPDDGVTIGGAAHDQTVVSGPIGTCDDGAAQTVTYDLAGGYTRLDGIVGLADGTATGLTVEVGFEADGEEVWWKTFAEGESTRVQLDLTGAQELTLTATGLFPGGDAAEGCVRAAYGDLTLR